MTFCKSGHIYANTSSPTIAEDYLATVHALSLEKLVNLANRELFDKIFLGNIHKCTENVSAYALTVAYLPKFSSPIAFTCVVCQKLNGIWAYKYVCGLFIYSEACFLTTGNDYRLRSHTGDTSHMHPYKFSTL